MVERFHRNLKEALKARLLDNDWVLALPWIMLGIRTAPKEDLNCSAAEMVFGLTLIVRGEFVSPPQKHYSLITEFVPIFMVILCAHLSKPWILLLLSLCELTSTKCPYATL